MTHFAWAVKMCTSMSWCSSSCNVTGSSPNISLSCNFQISCSDPGGQERGRHHGRPAQRGHLPGAAGGAWHRLLPHPGPAQLRGGLASGEGITHMVCSDKRSKNPTSIIMQYVKHSHWRLKYSVKWRTEILKVTIHHFTITLSLSSMRESDESIWIPITHSCEQEMLLPLPLPAHWPPLAPPAWRKQGSHLVLLRAVHCSTQHLTDFTLMSPH